MKEQMGTRKKIGGVVLHRGRGKVWIKKKGSVGFGRWGEQKK